MRYRHYTHNTPTYGAYLWRTASHRKEWTLDVYFSTHVFVFMFYRIK
jgi:hypothetical protein